MLPPTTGIPRLWLELAMGWSAAWDGPVGSIWVKDASDHNFLAITSLRGEIQERSKRGMEDNSTTMFLRRWERGVLRSFCSLKSTVWSLISKANEPISASPNVVFRGTKGARRRCVRAAGKEECVQVGRRALG